MDLAEGVLRALGLQALGQVLYYSLASYLFKFIYKHSLALPLLFLEFFSRSFFFFFLEEGGWGGCVVWEFCLILVAN